MGGGVLPAIFILIKTAPCRVMAHIKLAVKGSILLCAPNIHTNWFASPTMKAIPSRVRCAYLQGLTMVRTAYSTGIPYFHGNPNYRYSELHGVFHPAIHCCKLPPINCLLETPCGFSTQSSAYAVVFLTIMADKSLRS